MASCEKEYPETSGFSFVKGIPYYHFTDNDRLWLRARQGDEWIFENGQGVRHTYRLSVNQEIQAEHTEFTGPGLLSNRAVLVNYYDAAVLRPFRTDTSGAGSGGEFRFYRGAALRSNLYSGGSDKYTSRFYAKGKWHRFVGNTDLISDYFSCDGLKFPSGPLLDGPFAQLTVRGQQYGEVVIFVGTPRGPGCPLPKPSSLQELYYDRQAGLVRMVSLAGEVWDRVP
ncbi:hypothetical protein [Hymenobacter sp.]|uniref:hypothetical protein n=1 Tax=Hymenobacter sp. TaxID=1898978 RepID=UPI00286B9DF1|nr:hypothetical protein [Hymenobacter sp.]